MPTHMPCDLDAERAVLGACLIDPEMVFRLDWLEPRDFYREAHRIVWQVIRDLTATREPADYVSVASALMQRGKTEDVGGLEFLDGLTARVPNFGNAEHYGRIVQFTAMQRDIIHATGDIAGVAYTGRVGDEEGGDVRDAKGGKDAGMDTDADTPKALVERMAHMATWVTERLLKATRAATVTEETRSFADVLDDLADDILHRLDTPGLIGVPTGFTELDKHVLGIEPGELVYLCGRPGSGKSALGLKIALHAALHCAATHNGTVDVVTLEMSPRAQARRLVSDASEIDSRFVRRGFRYDSGNVDLDAHAAFEAARQQLRAQIGATLFVRGGGVSLAQLRAHIARAKAERNTRLVVIDQLDLMTERDRDEFSRITKMSRALKQMASSLGVGILCLCQLSRKCEERTNKRPMLSDLRQSGQLEQDADGVWGIYRPAYYDPQNPDPALQQFMELLILKARDGDAGAMIPLRYQKEITRCSDWPYPDFPYDATRPGATAGTGASGSEQAAQ